jgi:hypothetical protein
MKLRCGVIALALWSGISCAAPEESYVGVRIPPLPRQCKQLDEGILPSVLTYRTHSTRTIECSGVHMEWLLARAPSAANGGYWDVRDVLPHPKLKDKSELNRGECSFNGIADESIVAVVTKWRRTRDGGEAAVQISQAWRPNFKTERFQALPAKRVQCAYKWSRD